MNVDDILAVLKDECRTLEGERDALAARVVKLENEVQAAYRLLHGERDAPAARVKELEAALRARIVRGLERAAFDMGQGTRSQGLSYATEAEQWLRRVAREIEGGLGFFAAEDKEP